jgi:hypothetical protein
MRVPSIAAVAATLRNWCGYKHDYQQYICLCSSTKPASLSAKAAPSALLLHFLKMLYMTTKLPM